VKFAEVFYRALDGYRFLAISIDDEIETHCTLQCGARCVQRDRPGLVSDDPVRGNTAPSLKGLDRSLSIRSKDAVDPLRRRSPVPGGAIGEHQLVADRIPT
jgi:hypothetical protein